MSSSFITLLPKTLRAIGAFVEVFPGYFLLQGTKLSAECRVDRANTVLLSCQARHKTLETGKA
jgi:hypothetical protein